MWVQFVIITNYHFILRFIAYNAVQSKLERKCVPMLAEFHTGEPHLHMCRHKHWGCISGDDGCTPRGADDASITAHRWTKIKCRQKPPC